MSSADSIAELVEQAQELVLEEECVQREQFSDKLVAIGERLRKSLVRAESQIGSAHGHIVDAGELCAEIVRLRQHLDRVLMDAKVRMKHDRAEP